MIARFLLLFLFVAGCGSPAPVQEAGTVTAQEDERSAIIAAIEAYPDLQQIGVNVTDIEVEGEWALADIEPKEPVADEASVLLRKQGGEWQVLAVGSPLYGVGAEFNAPANLIDKWDL